MRRRVYSTILSNYFAASLEYRYVTVFLPVFAQYNIDGDSVHFFLESNFARYPQILLEIGALDRLRSPKL